MQQDMPGMLSQRVVNVYKLEAEFWEPEGALSAVKFGTSGHRGKAGGWFFRRARPRHSAGCCPPAY